MVVRSVIQRLCEDLRTRPSVQHTPGFIAWRLLDLDLGYKNWSEDDEGRKAGQSFADWKQAIDRSFRKVIDSDLYPDEYLGLVLTDEERRALTQALLDRLRWDPGGAVLALGSTLDLEAVLPLLALARSNARVAAPPNAQHAHGAIQAIEEILRYGSMDPQHLRPEDELLLHEVFETLHEVAREGAETGLAPRPVATRVLRSLTDYFGRAF